MAIPASAKKAEFKGDTWTLAPAIPESTLTPEQLAAVEKIILKSKLNLMEHRFFGSMALTMKWTMNEAVESYATDYTHIYYNPYKVLSEKTVAMCASSMCHETLHKIFLHNIRKPPGIDPRLCNMAMDYAINPVLVDEGWGWIANSDVKEFIYEQKYHGWNFERILEDLIKRGVQPPPDMVIDIYAPADPNDPEKPMSPEQIEQVKIQLKSQLINAHESHKMFGLKSGNLKDLIKGLKKSYVDWKSVLQRKVIGDHPENYTWKRPNRRFLHQDIYMPSVERFGVGDIYIWPDSSGSMSIEELKSVASEMRYIIQVIQPENVYIVELDAAIHGIKHFPKGSTPEAFDFKGRGGTDPKPFFNYVNKQANVHCAICLTDMGFDYNIKRPSYQTLFISTSGVEEAPFGTLITIPITEEAA